MTQRRHELPDNPWPTMPRRRLLRTIGSVTLALGVLTACGGGDDGDEEDEDEQQGDEQEQQRDGDEEQGDSEEDDESE